MLHKFRDLAGFLLIIAICLTASTSARAGYSDYAPQPTEPSQEPQYLDGEVLVVLSDDAGDAAGKAQKIEALVNGTVMKRISFPSRQEKRQMRRQMRRLRKQVVRLALPHGKSVEQAIAEIKAKKDPRILSVEPNYRLHILAVPNDTYFSNLWAMNNTGQTGGTADADIDAVAAWDITTGSSDIVVAVIDTGIDYLHPDLVDNMWVNTAEIADNGVDDDGNGYIDDIYGYDFVYDDGSPMDEHSHGTHCAGTIAGRGNNGLGITGVSWQCSLMACRFLDEDGSGYASDAIDAINYAVANGADILSNSWGGGAYSASLKAAIENAGDNGVLFVAAAGNSAANNDADPHYPSSYDVANMIAVAATDDDDSLASFSCYGARTVHLAAPGVGILSSVLDGQYDSANGTSMAAPHVSGVAALLLANDSTMTFQELKSRLIWTGDAIDELGDITITGRRLNAYNALTAESTMTVLGPNRQVHWVQGYTWLIEWASIGGGDTVDIYLLKAGAVHTRLADDVTNSGRYSWAIPDTLSPASDYSIWIDDGVSTDESDVSFVITDEPLDYFTEYFSDSSHAFDLQNTSLLLAPDGQSRYSACAEQITELPSSPTGGTALNLDDDDSELVTLTGNTVSVYGTSYDKLYVGSNGYITLGSADTAYRDSLSAHLCLRRISGLFNDLDPTAGGTISYKELSDRLAVTWADVPHWGTTNANTFQIEMFFDGQIRISWLSIEIETGVVGISEGLGAAVDFEQTDLSEYSECEVALEYIEITGLTEVSESSGAQFTCTAYYEDDSTEDVTSSELITWSENSDYAAVSSSGYLTTDDVDVYEQCRITATFDSKSDTHDVVIHGSATEAITITKCTVKAGKTTGSDRFVCSGTFGADADTVSAAESVSVQIYSAADNYLVYDETVDPTSFKATKMGYTYRRKIGKGESGAISLLRLDLGKSRFRLKAKNVDLTGLGCPLYVIFDLGSYIALGTADEAAVNGRKPIPAQLMSGYADTLAVQKAKVKSGEKACTDAFTVKGTLTVDDDSDVVDGVTITWGSDSFTVPAGSFTVSNSGAVRCSYETAEDALIRAKYDFVKSQFVIAVKKTTLVSKTGTVSFGISFGDYDESVEVSL